MSMMEWAKREVEIASKRERGDKPESEWDYGCACYDSALKAFESLCGDGHSGFSIGITKGILNRLIEGKPLTPIEDTEDVWNVCSSDAIYVLLHSENSVGTKKEIEYAKSTCKQVIYQQEAETKEKEWGWKKDPYIYPRSFYSPVGYTLWDPWGRRL